LGAEKYYTLANNMARSETPEQARLLDERTLRAWVGHPHLRVIDNAESFDDKMKRLYRETCRVLGVPVPLEVERKFLIRPFDVERHVEMHQVIDIEQVYLMHQNPEEGPRIRKRGQNGSYVYYWTFKRNIENGIRIEKERQIDVREYEWSLQFQIPGTQAVKKERICFVYKNQYFEYDRFQTPPDLHLLEIELTDMNDRFELPPYIEVVREVTNDPAYFNANLAKIT
jgi:CYTH domain-containing protein